VTSSGKLTFLFAKLVAAHMTKNQTVAGAK
jgi:hypothetical protein